ncbi:T9SS type A sorting domain-containing protein [bacterium]|nr:T9SS type A sorting domain-containing protein [bacterium]
MKTHPLFRFRKLIGACVAALFATGIASSASAQPAQGWNYSVEAVSIVQNETTGLYDVHAIIGIERHGPTTGTGLEDLSVAVELNPTAGDPHYGWIELTVEYDGASGPPVGCLGGGSCGGGCGNGYIDGVFNTLLCLEDGPGDCACKFPSITATFPGRGLQGGDDITVRVVPAPTSLPDIDPSDDQRNFTFEDEVLWDRRIDDVSVAPSPAGGYDIQVSGTMFHEGILNFLPPGASANFDSFFDVWVNGVLLSSHEIPFRPIPLAAICSCASACATWDGNTHSCQPFIPSLPGQCYCGWAWLDTVPNVPVVPADEIMVLLRPVPGALPELPGFEDDDIDSLTVGGPTGATVFHGTVADLLARNTPNPFRATTDIAFSLEANAAVTLDIYDLQGRRVRSLVDGDTYEAGRSHRVSWDGRTQGGERVPGGVYFARITADGRTETRKMTLLH